MAIKDQKTAAPFAPLSGIFLPHLPKLPIKPTPIRSILLGLLAPAVLPAQSPPPPTAPTGHAVVLSPVQVNAGSEQGYLATQTLSGARLKTDLKDIGSALTVFTERQSSSRTASIGACS